MKNLLPLALLTLLAATPAAPPTQRVRQFRQAHERELLAEFEQLVAIPNVAADTAGLGRTRRACRRWCSARCACRVQPAPSFFMPTTTASP